ncbi:Glucose-6-phosphate 1-epimerase [Escovopsis weberi]|uniref:Glucose-6-phosphate 1-epimerase n=1 Tax=Escovopsis weberi TaxID=150374 RepID=A0A0M9VXU0_ESCWE|nr:Glucose-6-phosphate 1-epimerase [Escovopsis weberi]
MVDRPHKPSALAATPGLPPQAQVAISHDNARVTAQLPSGESVEVLLFGATVTSWKDGRGEEKLWLSEAARLDGSKAVRGGIPLVFPVFGTAPDHPATSQLSQHGFARTSHWRFFGKSTSEGSSSSSVKLDFGLSSDNLDAAAKKAWPYKFGLLYSVTLDVGSLSTALVVTNEGDEPFECQTLLHTYFKIDVVVVVVRQDISAISISGLENAPYVDKVDGAKAKTEAPGAVTFSGETDRVYTPPKGPKHPIVVEGSSTRFRIVRDNLEDVVVWNPAEGKAAGMADFEPKHGWRNMVCVEAGSVRGWQRLEKGDTFEGAQTIYLS